jgi:hypothetical protein
MLLVTPRRRALALVALAAAGALGLAEAGLVHAGGSGYRLTEAGRARAVALLAAARAALGAAGWRAQRSPSCYWSLAAAAVGLAVTWSGLQGLVGLLPDGLPRRFGAHRCRRHRVQRC